MKASLLLFAFLALSAVFFTAQGQLTCNNCGSRPPNTPCTCGPAYWCWCNQATCGNTAPCSLSGDDCPCS